MALFDEFYVGSTDLGRLNYEFISLILKVHGASDNRQFRPITVINVISHILVKGLLLFLMSFYNLHETLHHDITKVQARSFWVGENNKQKYHMVSCHGICRSCDQGGLGIMCSKRMNIALLSRWLWHCTRPWWSPIRHHTEQVLARTTASLLSAVWWIPILDVRRLAAPGSPHQDLISVCSGAATLYWFGRWAGDLPFTTLFPGMFSIAVEPRISIKVAFIDLWRLAFRRPFGPSNLAAWPELLNCIALHELDVDPAADHISSRLEPSGVFST
ncbi:putative TdLSC37 protein [Hordeum vulgare]|nr:putative TdLSC37 protein [Hordeum vulgare]